MQTTHPGQAALSTESTEPTQPAEERIGQCRLPPAASLS